MAELMNDPSKWAASDGGSPPADTWDGRRYVFDGNYEYLWAIGAQAGDTLTFDVLAQQNGIASFILYENGVQVLAGDGTTVQTRFTWTVVDPTGLHFEITNGTPGCSPFTVMTFSPPAPDACKEIGRATRAYVSAYTLDRVQIVRAIRTQQRCLVADFNGAIGKGRTIVSATWRCTAPWITILSGAAVAEGGRSTQVSAKLGNCGLGHVKCSVTLDNGEIYIQMFEVRVVDAPWFYEAFDQPGPYELTATV